MWAHDTDLKHAMFFQIHMISNTKTYNTYIYTFYIGCTLAGTYGFRDSIVEDSSLDWISSTGVTLAGFATEKRKRGIFFIPLYFTKRLRQSLIRELSLQDLYILRDLPQLANRSPFPPFYRLYRVFKVWILKDLSVRWLVKYSVPPSAILSRDLPKASLIERRRIPVGKWPRDFEDRLLSSTGMNSRYILPNISFSLFDKWKKGEAVP